MATLQCTHPTVAHTTNANIDQTTTHTLHIPMHTQAQEMSTSPETLRLEQSKDLRLRTLIAYLEKEELPENPKEARQVMLMSQDLVMIDGVAHFVEKGEKRKRVAVPEQSRNIVLQEYHGGVYSGHFSCSKLYGAVSSCWWWPGLYKDVVEHCRNCPDCAVVSGSGRRQVPPLQAIPVQKPFQKFGVDIMELPVTKSRNC